MDLMRVGESLPPLRKRVSTLQCVLLEDKHKESLLCVLSSCLPSQLLCVEALFSPSLLEALCIQVNLLSTFVMMWRKEVEQSCSASFLADPLEEIQANLNLWLEVNQKSCPFIPCLSWCSCTRWLLPRTLQKSDTENILNLLRALFCGRKEQAVFIVSHFLELAIESYWTSSWNIFISIIGSLSEGGIYGMI